MTRAHKFCDTQPTTFAVLLNTQLMIAPMIPGNASAAFTPNLPSSDAKALSLFLHHSFKQFSSLGGGGDAAVPPPSPVSTSTSTPIAIPKALSTEAIVMPCSLSSILIFSANEVSLSNTLAIGLFEACNLVC